MAGVFGWLQGTMIAATVRESVLLTASLSAVHLLGVTLVGGGALAAGLRSGGLLLADRPAAEVTRPAGRLILLGAAIAVTSGLLLFAPRATDAVKNGLFLTKMTLLTVAVACHLLLYGGDRWSSNLPVFRAARVLGAALWLSVAAFGCAYILLE